MTKTAKFNYWLLLVSQTKAKSKSDDEDDDDDDDAVHKPCSQRYKVQTVKLTP